MKIVCGCRECYKPTKWGLGWSFRSFAIFGHYSTPSGFKLNFPVKESNIGKVSKRQIGTMTWLKLLLGGGTCPLLCPFPASTALSFKAIDLSEVSQQNIQDISIWREVFTSLKYSNTPCPKHFQRLQFTLHLFMPPILISGTLYWKEK